MLLIVGYWKKMKEKFRIAFIGNPNCGKTSLFNHMTGLNQRVGNFAGVTVEAKTSAYQTMDGHSITLIDLPGAYSLYPASEDEKVLTDVMLQEENALHPDAVVYVADCRVIDRQLVLLSQVSDLGFPLVICLTNTDLCPDNLVQAWKGLLIQEMKYPVIALSNRTGNNIKLVEKEISRLVSGEIKPLDWKFFNPQISKVEGRELAAVGIDNHSFKDALNWVRNYSPYGGEEATAERVQLQVFETMKRYRIFDQWSARIKTSLDTVTATNSNITAKMDKLLTHPFWGVGIFFLIMLIMFQLIFSFAQIPMDWIDLAFSKLGSILRANLPEHSLTSMLTEGIIPGLAGIFIFIPQIGLLFMVLTLLEEVGYMSRVIYMTDHLLLRFGLNGRSVIGLISGGACAVPAIMSTRSIASRRERLITNMIIPFIPCSARLPVYTSLIVFIVPSMPVWGFLNLQGLVFMGLYLAGFAAALALASMMHTALPDEDPGMLAMQLPFYQWPQATQIWMVVKNKVKSFIVDAGKIILLISMVLWFLASTSWPGEHQKVRAQVREESEKLKLDSLKEEYLLEARLLETSFAGKLGKLFEPLIEPLGFDWRIGIALITSFAAREVFVGTMSTIYSIGPNSEIDTLRAKMKADQDEFGRPYYSPRRALSLVLFYTFALQCMSTVAVMRRETGSWYWPTIQFLFMGGFAWFVSFVVWNT